jgi:hypothetical protein
MFGMLVLLVLAIPVLSVLAIVLAMGTREHVRRLEFRLAGIEAQIGRAHV